MKRLCSLAVTLFLATYCVAQEQPKAKKSKESAKTEFSKTARIPTGPISFGALRIGMSKEAVEALKESDGVYLTGPFALFDPKSPLPPGLKMYSVPIMTPLSTKPVDMLLSFMDGNLTIIDFSLQEISPSGLKAQIAQKYGLGKVDDKRKEEQCIYRNGNNFKITNGYMITSWVEPLSATESIETYVLEDISASCPMDLKHDSIVVSKHFNLMMKLTSGTGNRKKADLF